MKGISIEVMIYIQHEAKTSIKFSDRIKGYQGLAYLEDIFNEKIRYSKDVDHAHPKTLGRVREDRMDWPDSFFNQSSQSKPTCTS